MTEKPILNVGINGFGRIGRCITRHIYNSRPDIKVIKINASGNQESNLHLLKYDSIHGRNTGTIDNDTKWSHSRDINDLDWSDVDLSLIHI